MTGKITDLTGASLPLDPNDLVEVVQGVGAVPTNRKVPVSELGGGGGGGGTGGEVAIENSGVEVVPAASLIDFATGLSAVRTGDGRVQVNASGGSGGGLWEHVGTAVATSSGDILDIAGIDPTFTALRVLLRWSGASGPTFPAMRLNGDAGNNYQVDRAGGDKQTRSEFVWFFSSATAGAHPGLMVATISQPSTSSHALFGTDRVVYANPAEMSWGVGSWLNPSTQKIGRITVLTTVGMLAAGSRLTLEGTRE